jgi:rare lipoprotein A
MICLNLTQDQGRHLIWRGRMRSATYRILALGVIAAGGLSACMDGITPGTSRTDGAVSTGSQMGERDIEDASIFSRRELGLWDGRPSLGGVWVAHPEATTPERVIIRNIANGQETIGALFRRERLNPGPAFQVSAEAANAVGILAGAPTEIEVVALRTEQIEDEAPPPPVASPAPVPTAAPSQSTETANVTQAEDFASSQGEVAPIVTLQGQAPRQRPGFLGRLLGRDTSAQPAAEEIETEILDDQLAMAQIPAPQPTSLAPQQSSPAAQQPAAASTQQPAPAAQPATTVERPFIQLGIFSVEGNARSAETMARNSGLSARTVEGRTQGNAFWRVVIGPAQTQSEQAELLARVKALGFNDAYTVRR